jgi:hypothetical protein
MVGVLALLQASCADVEGRRLRELQDDNGAHGEALTWLEYHGTARAVPVLLQDLGKRVCTQEQLEGAEFWLTQAMSAENAVPIGTREVNDLAWFWRKKRPDCDGYYALRAVVGRLPRECIPALAVALRDDRVVVRLVAVDLLDGCGAEYTAVVLPMLRPMTSDAAVEVAFRATFAVKVHEGLEQRFRVRATNKSSRRSFGIQ